jgi:hypothetical protein
MFKNPENNALQGASKIIVFFSFVFFSIFSDFYYNFHAFWAIMKLEMNGYVQRLAILSKMRKIRNINQKKNWKKS